jgi:hypothetical protein
MARSSFEKLAWLIHNGVIEERASPVAGMGLCLEEALQTGVAKRRAEEET